MNGIIIKLRTALSILSCLVIAVTYFQYVWIYSIYRTHETSKEVSPLSLLLSNDYENITSPIQSIADGKPAQGLTFAQIKLEVNPAENELYITKHVAKLRESQGKNQLKFSREKEKLVPKLSENQYLQSKGKNSSINRETLIFYSTRSSLTEKIPLEDIKTSSAATFSNGEDISLKIIEERSPLVGNKTKLKQTIDNSKSKNIIFETSKTPKSESATLENQLDIQKNQRCRDISSNSSLHVPLVVRTRKKQILAYTTFMSRMEVHWNRVFVRMLEGDCPISDCELTFDKSMEKTADAILFHVGDMVATFTFPHHHPPHQSWVFFNQEAPPRLSVGRLGYIRAFNNLFNWTMTYRKDSDVYVPYGRFVFRKGTDYITEKFFVPFKLGMIPVVFGGGNYTEMAPKHSFIHAFDFDTPRELAKYLVQVANNETLYNSYFRWKRYYEVDLGYPFRPFICDLCAKLHGKEIDYRNVPFRSKKLKRSQDPNFNGDTKKNGIYFDLYKWFAQNGTCTFWAGPKDRELDGIRTQKHLKSKKFWEYEYDL